MNPKIFLMFIGAMVLLEVQAQHISDFTSLPGGNQVPEFLYPNTHTFHYIIQHGDAITNGTMDDQFDFTGYVPIGGSSAQGYLSINHEKTPGGVTIFDFSFDQTIQHWYDTNGIPVDFSGVGGTSRNCSGAVTPWGTIVSSEENILGDNNGDGYNDYGWNVEIDPATRQIIDYPGGLAGGDKIWSMGSFRHENIAIHPNQRTVYQGEDVGGGHLFKFVSDVAGDFSSGNLYVYVGPKSGNGNWVQINNTSQDDQNTSISQANAVGATDFGGGEDVEFNVLDGKVYFAVKNENRVYRFQDDSPLTGGTVTGFETFVGGMSYTVETSAGPMSVNWGGGNDNLAFDDLGNLWVLQDGSNNHIWVVGNGHTQTNPDVRIFGHSPAGSEPTGITFTPDYKYLFMSFQHPAATNNATAQPDAFQQDVFFDKDVAIVISRKEFLGNCHTDLYLHYQVTGLENHSVSNTITNVGEILGGANVVLHAGDCILLDSGFEVQVGGEMLAEIQGCSVVVP